MKKNKKPKLFFLFLILLLSSFFLGSNFVLAEGEEASIPQYIKYIFNFSIMLVGVAAFVALIYSGFLRFTSFGDAKRIKESKERFRASFVGLLIVLLSYVIITTINPQLVIWEIELKTAEIETPEIPIVPTPPPTVMEEANTSEEDFKSLADYQIERIEEGLELAKESSALFGRTKSLVDSCCSCSCSRKEVLGQCCDVCCVAVWAYCYGEPCVEAQGIIPGLSKMVEQGEGSVVRFQKETIEALIKTEELKELKGILTALTHCRLDYRKKLLICGQAKDEEYKEGCDEFNFYCVY